MSDVRSQTRRLSMAPFVEKRDFARPWDSVDVLTLPHESSDRYIVGFAHSTVCVESALRLRYEIFNLELDEGLAGSVESGLDRDEFDDRMTHVVLLERATHRVVGTYRVQDATSAGAHGFYSAQEYDLAPFEPYLAEGLEMGRACLAVDHRTHRAIMSIWIGIGAFMRAFGLRYAFGCCSLTSQDPDDGWRALRVLREKGHVHPELFVRALESYSCGAASRESNFENESDYPIPKLFRTYLRLGGTVISEPAIDRAFGTVDFLVVIDVKKVGLSRLDVLR